MFTFLTFQKLLTVNARLSTKAKLKEYKLPIVLNVIAKAETQKRIPLQSKNITIYKRIVFSMIQELCLTLCQIL
jgi:hypothetical protein